MSEFHEELKKPDAGRAMLHATGIGCLGLFLWGLAEVLWASESGSTIKLVWGPLLTLFGGIGAAYVGRAVFIKRQ